MISNKNGLANCKEEVATRGHLIQWPNATDHEQLRGRANGAAGIYKHGRSKARAVATLNQMDGEVK